MARRAEHLWACSWRGMSQIMAAKSRRIARRATMPRAAADAAANCGEGPSADLVVAQVARIERRCRYVGWNILGIRGSAVIATHGEKDHV